MADKEKEISVKVSADTSAFRSETKKALESVQGIKKQAGFFDRRQRANDVKRQKQDREAKQERRNAKQDLAAEKESIKLAEKQLKLIDKQNEALKQQHALIQQINKKSGGGQGGRGGGLFGGGGGGSGRGGSGGGGGALTALLGGGAKLLAGALVSAITMPISMGLGMIFSGYGQYKQYGKGTVGLAPLARRSNKAQFEDRLWDTGAQFGYEGQDSANLAMSLGRSTGSTNSRLLDLTRHVQAMGRLGSMSPDEISGMAGGYTRAGMTVGTRTGLRAFEKIFRDAVTAGLDQSRTGEHMQAVGSLAQSASGTLGGAVNVGGISDLLARVGRGGAGLQGERGAGVVSGIDSAVKGGGGSEQAKAFFLRAFGFGNVGGSSSSYYDALRAQQQGILGSRDPSGTFGRIWGQMQGETNGDRRMSILRMSSMGMGSIDVLERFLEAFEKGNLSEVAKDEANKQRSIPDLLTESLSVMKSGFARVATTLATNSTQDLRAGRNISDEALAAEDALHDAIMKIVPGLTAILEPVLKGITKLIEMAIPILESLNEILTVIGRLVADFLGEASPTDLSFLSDITKAGLTAASLTPEERQRLGDMSASPALVLRSRVAALDEGIANHPEQREMQRRLVQEAAQAVSSTNVAGLLQRSDTYDVLKSEVENLSRRYNLNVQIGVAPSSDPGNPTVTQGNGTGAPQ